MNSLYVNAFGIEGDTIFPPKELLLEIISGSFSTIQDDTKLDQIISLLQQEVQIETKEVECKTKIETRIEYVEVRTTVYETTPYPKPTKTQKINRGYNPIQGGNIKTKRNKWNVFAGRGVECDDVINEKQPIQTKQPYDFSKGGNGRGGYDCGW